LVLDGSTAAAAARRRSRIPELTSAPLCPVVALGTDTREPPLHGPRQDASSGQG